MIGTVWGKLSGREKLVGYAAATVVIAHLVGSFMTDGYYNAASGDALGLFAIASEPIGKGPWRELPDGGFIGIDAEHRILEAPLRGPGGLVAA